MDKQYYKMSSAYEHVTAVTPSKDSKYYMIDIDTWNDVSSEDLKLFTDNLLENGIELIRSDKKMAEGPIYHISTKSGLHLLVPSFDREYLRRLIEDTSNITYEIKNDADTVLYIP